MAIFEEDLFYLSKKSSEPYFEETFDFYKNCIKTALNNIKEKFDFFDEDDVKIYVQGSYKNGTMVDELAKLELVVEFGLNSFGPIDRTPVLKLKTFWSWVQKDLTKKRIVTFKPNIHLALIKKLMLESLIQSTHNEGIYNNSKSIFIPAHAGIKIPCEILPCYTLSDSKDCQSVIIYDSFIDKNVAAFPRLHCEHLAEKDKATNGQFIKMVRIFRNIRDILVSNQVIDEKFAPSYFIECLLYNVPNKLFEGKFQSSMLKILNYLANCNLSKFVCAHNQFKMFGNNSDAWTTYKARSFINLIIQIWEEYQN